MNLSYELIKHIKRKSFSAISTAKYIYDTIYIIVDHRVGIFPFSVNKCDVTDTLLQCRSKGRGQGGPCPPPSFFPKK